MGPQIDKNGAIAREFLEDEDGVKRFQFRGSFFAPITEIAWLGDVGFFSREVADVLLNNKYGRNLTEEEREAYNKLAQETNESDKNKAQEAQQDTVAIKEMMKSELKEEQSTTEGSLETKQAITEKPAGNKKRNVATAS